MIDPANAVAAIAGMTVVTVLLRALPFLGARYLNRSPIIVRVGRFLPPAIMTLLVLHSLRGNASVNHAGPWEEIVAVSVAILLQLWLRQALASMLAATLLYVALRNAPFFG